MKSMNKNTIKCKKCGSEIEISEALTHQIEDQILNTLEAKHKTELEEATKLAGDEVSKKVSEQFTVQLDRLQKENLEERERNKKLTSQLGEMLEEMRTLRRRDEDREVEMKKKILEEEERIRTEAIKQTEEGHRFKDLEKDKKLQDALKQVDELRTKMEQGSQQSQGEVLELELEKFLKAEFPSDNIIEVKKGERGADIVQEVVDKWGRRCGTILWETKNAKWQTPWIKTLKDNQRAKKADLAVLVSIAKPDWLEAFVYRDGIWVTVWGAAVSLAIALRINLMSLYHEKTLIEGKNEKKDIMYEYLMGVEFRHRVESIVEGFSNMQLELESEKRWFSKKWNRQEKEMRKVLDNTYGMVGDLEGITGKALPEIKTLELPESAEEEPAL